MYKMEVYKTDAMKEVAKMDQPFGPSFTEEQVAEADTLEVWASNFDDEGKDFVEFRLTQDGEIIHSKRVGGF